MAKAVLFDLGNTLIDARRENHEVFQSILAALGVKPPDGDAIIDAIKKTGKEFREKGLHAYNCADHLEDFWVPWDKAVLTRLGIEGDLARYAREIHYRWFDHLYIYAYDDSVPTLEALKERGYLLGIISNGLEDEIYDVLRRSGINHHLFNALVGSDTFRCEKPGQRIFTETLKRMGVEAQDSAFVGDRSDTDGGATKVGMRFFLIDRKGKGGMPGWAEGIESLSELLTKL
ncbi:MAG: HAD family hydrolase [Euryarchaeota archaeon]|nr:HAD family hydrolase [Euryarchaeota archaeon]